MGVYIFQGMGLLPVRSVLEPQSDEPVSRGEILRDRGSQIALRESFLSS